jgi:hypothetical protein
MARPSKADPSPACSVARAFCIHDRIKQGDTLSPIPEHEETAWAIFASTITALVGRPNMDYLMLLSWKPASRAGARRCAHQERRLEVSNRGQGGR